MDWQRYVQGLKLEQIAANVCVDTIGYPTGEVSKKDIVLRTSP